MSVQRERSEILAEARSWYELFRRLESRAVSYGDSGKLGAAAAVAQMAADLAWHNPTGLFASTKLEALLRDLSDQLQAPKGTDLEVFDGGNYDGDPEHVLHVLTTASPGFGPQWLARRWIERDGQRRHSVALTRQGSDAVPGELIDTLALSGGHLHRVDDQPGTLLDRAVRLRALCLDADAIVLHILPCDVVPLLAFGGSFPGPPVLYLNHSDQVFWLGAGSSNVVVNLRREATRLCRERRALTFSHQVLLPLPVEPGEPAEDRAELRSSLGLPPNELILLTVAPAWRFATVGRFNMMAEMADYLSEREGVRLVAIGPRDDERWRAARLSSGDRITLLDMPDDLTPWFQAADIYLDSYPLTSLTSMLQAISFGVPALGFAPKELSGRTLFADDPALLPEHYLSTTRDDYLERLEYLCGDARERQAVATLQRRRVLSVHDGVSWSQSLDQAYEAAAENSPRPPEKAADKPKYEDIDWMLTEIHRRTGMTRGYSEIVRRHMRLLPGPARLRAFFACLLRGAWPGLGSLRREMPGDWSSRLVPEDA